MEKQFNPRIGDMIKFRYLDEDIIKGKLLEINGKKAKVLMGISHRKTEEVYTDEVEVNISDLLPFDFKE